MHAQGTALPAGQGRSVGELSDLDSPYTVAEVARFLRKHVNTVYAWIADGTLQAEKIGGTYYIPRWVLAPLVSSARRRPVRAGHPARGWCGRMSAPKGKRCPRCGQVKPAAEFYRRRRSLRLSPYCKPCQRTAAGEARRRRRADPASVALLRAVDRTRQRRRRAVRGQPPTGGDAA